MISLGAGYDTLFWNLTDSNLTPSKYVEIDLKTVTRQKTALIHGKKTELFKAFGEGRYYEMSPKALL